MYSSKQIEFNGKYDYDKESAEKFASWGGNTFSVGIFKWTLKSNKKELKRGKVEVRVHGSYSIVDKVFSTAENVVIDLAKNEWDGRKNVFIK